MIAVDVLQTYFRGERQVGLALAAWGVALLLGAAWVWRNERSPFGTSLLVPLALAGLGFSIGGAFLAIKTGPQLAELTARLSTDGDGVVAAELTRMAKVNANWPRLKLAWGVITVVALAFVLVVKREWSEGVGLGLLVIVATLFLVDVFAERRAVIYRDALQASAPGPSATAPGTR